MARTDDRILDYTSAHVFVENSKNVRWDGWDIVTFEPKDKAILSKRGVFRNGQWGLEHRVKVDDNGLWSVKVVSLRRNGN